MHVLPQKGGLYDQDCLFVISLDWIVQAQQFKEEMAHEEALRRQRQQTGR